MSNPLKYTAPVRRGFLHVLHYLQEDCTMHIFDPSHPGLRRLKGEARKDAEKALRWLFQEATDQWKWDAAKLASQQKEAGECPLPPPDAT